MAENDGKTPEVSVERKVGSIKLTAKMLDGLTFTGSTPKEVKTDSGVKTKHIPFERPLRASDVLAAKDTGNGTVIIVTGDGQKHEIAKEK